MTEKNQFKAEGIMEKGYGLIAKKVMKDTELSVEAKAIYAYLASYAGAGNTAYPSISLMCADLKIGENRFYRHRKQLVEKGYIVIKQHRNKEGWLNNVYQLPIIPTPYFEGTQNECTQNEGTQNKGTNSNSSKSNSINSNSSNKDHSPAKAEQIPNKKIVDYLNKKTGRRYSHTANKNKDLIQARWNEGFRFNDFVRVIDIKVAEWKGTDYEQYLRPATLFGNKFDMYLNQPEKKGNDSNNWGSEYDDLF